MQKQLSKNSDKRVDESGSQDLNIYDVLSIIWSGKLLIFLICFVSLSLSTIYLNFSEFKYSVSLKVIPVSKPQINRVSQSISSISSILGVGDEVGGNESTYDYELYKTLITSYQVSNFLSKDQSFMISIFKSEWDAENKIWRTKKLSPISKFKNFVKKILGVPVNIQGKPSADRLHKFLTNNISISAPKKSKTSMVTIQMLTSNPDLGVEIIQKVHNVANDILRARSSLRTEKYINFLNTNLSKTTQQDQRIALISTLSSQLQKRMDESSDLPFVSEKFGDVMVSQYPVYPNSKFILVSALVIGFFHRL